MLLFLDFAERFQSDDSVGGEGLARIVVRSRVIFGCDDALGVQVVIGCVEGLFCASSCVVEAIHCVFHLFLDILQFHIEFGIIRCH